MNTRTPPTVRPISTADGSTTAHSERYQQSYHSIHGALSESRVVYLEASGVLAQLVQGKACSVMEVGFGLGLNYLITADAALEHRAILHYEAWEHDLISGDLLSGLGYQRLLNHPSLVEELVAVLDDPEVDIQLPNPVSRPVNSADSTSLLIHQNDVSGAELPVGRYDAIYLDAFSPDVNPECWTEELLGRFGLALRAGGKLATYCARGSLRRGLEAHGFSVERRPGPTGKREIIVATSPGPG